MNKKKIQAVYFPLKKISGKRKETILFIYENE